MCNCDMVMYKYVHTAGWAVPVIGRRQPLLPAFW